MDFNKYADKYDTSWMGGLSGRFYKDLAENIEIKNGDSVLDIGCGTGTMLHLLSSMYDINGYGIDVSEQMLNNAKMKCPSFDFQIADCADLPYEDRSMDVVMACMAYHHFENQDGFRKEMLRVLKPGGMLYISDPRFPGIIRAILNTAVKEAGFHSTKINQKTFLSDGFCNVKVKKDFYVQLITAKKCSY